MDELPNPITRSEQYLAKIAGAEPTLPTPITREERYLAKIAGEDVDIPPAPITRTEQYLAAIVEGGGGVEVESLSATENGTYTAEEGKAYSPVNVNVPNSYAAGDEGKVVSNGALVAQTSDSVTENGTVDTTLINSLEVNVPQGGGEEAPEKDVNFIDYDGTILYSYTAIEFAALTELPALVSHDGMAAATAWNWTLADAKAYVAKYGSLWIGQEYERLEIDIELLDTAKSPYLTFGVNGRAVIYWGDGTSDTITGTNHSVQQHTQHNYSAGGKYTISVVPDTEATQITLSPSSSLLLGAYDGQATNNVKYASCIKTVRVGSKYNVSSDAFKYCTQLKSITVPHTVIYFDSATAQYCYSLERISFPKETTYFGQDALSNCTSLQDVSMPVLSYGNYTGNNSLQNCCNLKRIVLPENLTAISNYTFSGCYGLKEIVSLATTPPTIRTSALNIGSSAGLTIYVPYSADHSVLNAYKAASGWSTFADAMVELPE